MIKQVVKVMPIIEGSDGEEYYFHVLSTQEKLNRRFSADDRKDAVKSRNKLIQLLEDNNYIVTQSVTTH